MKEGGKGVYGKPQIGLLSAAWDEKYPKMTRNSEKFSCLSEERKQKAI
jgi:hypothetical protein